MPRLCLEVGILTLFQRAREVHDAHIEAIGEHASLNAIHDAVPSFCPKSYAHGAMKSSPSTFFLATDFLDQGASGSPGSGQSLAAKLAKLHSTPAPGPGGGRGPGGGGPGPAGGGAAGQD